MSSWLLAAIGALTGLLAALVAPRVAAAEITRCHLDNPARFLAAREEQIAKGREATREPIPCADEADPQTVPLELVLPMPCGHAVYFRRVDLPVEHVLDQVPASFGDAPSDGEDVALATSTAPWDARVGGAFTVENDTTGSLRSYYIGKYELTEPQWRLFEAGLLVPEREAIGTKAEACREHNARLAEVDPRQVPPATRLSWYDAIAFTRAYNDWLLNIDRQLVAAGREPLLPWEQGTPGFVRLPSEAEWEFAARGGTVGSSRQDRARRVYLVRDPKSGRIAEPNLSDIAYLSNVNAPEPISGVGRRRSNLLDLYDMVGNAEEVVLDLFRAARPDGLHGQIGGAILRGGSSHTSKETIGVGYRREAPFFSLDGEIHSSVVGTRLALSVPFFVSGFNEAEPYSAAGLANPDFERSVREARALLTRADVRESERDEVLEDIQQLRARAAAGQVGEEGLNDWLADVQSTLERSNALQQEAARTALQEQVLTGVAVAVGIRRVGQNLYAALNQLQHRVATVAQMQKDDPKRAESEAKLESVHTAISERQQELEAQYEIYLATVAALASTRLDSYESALEVVEGRLAANGLGVFSDLLDTQVQHVARLRANSGEISAEFRREWLYEVDAVREQRERTFR